MDGTGKEMSQAPFAYMQMRPSAAVQNPQWLRAASSAGLGWGGMGELLLSIYSTSEDRETGLPQLPPPPKAGTVWSVNKDSKKWNLPLFSAFRQLFSWARTGGYTRVQNSISRRTATLSLTQKMTFNALIPPLARRQGN